MIHTYRDEQFLRSRFFSPAYVGFLLLVGGFLTWLVVATDFSLGHRVGFAGLVVAILVVHQYWVYRHEHYRRCGESSRRSAA